MVAHCHGDFTSAAGFDYELESGTEFPPIQTASYVQSISGHNCMTYSLTFIYSCKCGTYTEVVPTLGKPPQSSSLKQTLPFSNSYRETSSWSTLLRCLQKLCVGQGWSQLTLLPLGVVAVPHPLSVMCLQSCEVVTYPKDWVS